MGGPSTASVGVVAFAAGPRTPHPAGRLAAIMGDVPWVGLPSVRPC
jgi:hypothetical protein